MTSLLVPTSASESVTSSSSLTERKLINPPEEKSKKDPKTPEMRATIVHKNIVLVIVAVALLLDGMLNMVILPLVPEFIKYFKASATSAQIMDYFHLNVNSTSNETLIDENMKFEYNGNDIAIGFLFATKPFIQLIVNPFSGAIIDHIGHDIPMIIGLCIQFSSTMIFTYTSTFYALFIARGLQGVGSAIATTSGFSMIAHLFVEYGERAKAMSIVITALALGSFMSVPFSGFLFEYVGKRVPFICLAILALLDAFLLIASWHSKCCDKKEKAPKVNFNQEKKTPIWALLADPYVLICSMTLIMANLPLAFTQPNIAVWMKTTMGASESEIGYVWLSGFIPHISGVYFTVLLIKKYSQHQYLFLMVGLTIEAISCLSIPFITNYFVLMIPISIICFGYGLIDATVLPTVAYLVDTRHAKVYGSVYAIIDISYSVCYAFGPMISGLILHFIGFKGLSIILTVILITFVPFLLFLRKIYREKHVAEQMAIANDD